MNDCSAIPTAKKNSSHPTRHRNTHATQHNMCPTLTLLGPTPTSKVKTRLSPDRSSSSSGGPHHTTLGQWLPTLERNFLEITSQLCLLQSCLLQQQPHKLPFFKAHMSFKMGNFLEAANKRRKGILHPYVNIHPRKFKYFIQSYLCAVFGLHDILHILYCARSYHRAV